MKRILISVAAVAAAIGAWAIPAKPMDKTVTLVDGTQTKITLVGDEHYHCWMTAGGQVVSPRPDGLYELTGANAAAVSEVRQQRAAAAQRMIKQRAPRREESNPSRGLVILVNFQDRKFSTPNPHAAFNEMLNQRGYSANGATGSAKDYFEAASAGQYSPVFDVFGPVTVSHDERYYVSGGELGPGTMVAEACELIKDSVDFSKYDNDGDRVGMVDFVFIYYAGHSQAEGADSTHIWPHRSAVASTEWYGEDYGTYQGNQPRYNGKYIFDYACTSELKGNSGTNMCGIGPFCHEFGHVLGLPDFYDTQYSDYHKTLGRWDIMDAGSYLNEGRTPPTYSAYERFCLGWLTPILINTPQADTLEAITTSNKAYIVAANGKHNLDPDDPDPELFYLLENRQQTGWDTYLPGHGMMITRVNYDSRRWAYNLVNNDGSDMGVTIIAADGKRPTAYEDYTGYYGKQGDLFPTDGVHSYSPYARFPINDIRERDGVIYFNFIRSAGFYSVTADYNTAGGTVSGLGTYLPGEMVTITATPNSGYIFLGWKDGNKDQTISFPLNTDTLLSPWFAIGGACGDSLTWYYEDGWLVIQGNGPMYDYRSTTGSQAPWFTRGGYVTDLFIDDGVETIGDYAFFRLSNATDAYLPESVTKVGRAAFALTGLEAPLHNSHLFAYLPTTYRGDYTVPEGITNIASGAFYQTTGLTSLTLPASVSSIDELAFYRCTGLTSLKVEATEPPAAREASFAYTASDRVTVQVPCASLSQYRANWYFFSNISGGTLDVTLSVNDEQLGTATAVSADCGSVSVQAVPAEGCEFVSWSDGSTDALHTVEVYEPVSLTAEFRRVSSGLNEAAAPRVYAVDGCVVVEGTDGSAVSVCDLTGREVAATTAPARIALRPGMYMVCTADAVRKVVIK